MKEGAAADDAVARATKKTTSRRDLSRHEGFEQVSPEVGELDESAFDELMAESPDDALGLLAELTGATDESLRALARRLAGRLMIDLARSGPLRSKGIGKMTTRAFDDDGGDLDVDASLDALVEHRITGVLPTQELKVRSWARPGTALCLVVDRSGSMGGKPLATSAVAAAAVASRAPADYSVIAFAKDVVVAKSQDVPKSGERVVNDVLSLRGFGTTDVSAALRTAIDQLSRSTAGRKITVLLSDCRATEGHAAEVVAGALDELVIIAPAADSEEARAFAERVGARLATIDGPSDIVAALSHVLVNE